MLCLRIINFNLFEIFICPPDYKDRDADHDGADAARPEAHIGDERLTHNLIDYSLLVGYNIEG